MINFDKIHKKILKLKKTKNNVEYHIPGLWINSNEKIFKTKIYDYFDEQFNVIKSLKLNNTLSQRIVYNMLMRYSTSFPHQNGVDFTELSINYNESGSILKTIALLPYIHSLGCNTLYLLPITEIGIDGKKGNLGSPYAIRNHYKLDENLNEPFLEISIEDQFKALIEACKHLGIKIILEFVFRTSSIDSDMALIHPDWFYWIKYNEQNESAFKPANFNDEEIELISAKINQKDYKNLPKPQNKFIDLFCDTPQEVFKKGNKIYGKLENNKLAVIPSAFADWPPNDTQPLWSDVTYLKMHNHKEYNYIAYNTIRMYDDDLTDEYKNVELWEYLTGIIPFYQNNYGIDGVMIDMGHALPISLREEIIRKSRENNPEFILWEENFGLSQESVEAGYNASLGYVCFDSDKYYKMKEIIGMLSRNESPIEFFLTPETHNTHRAVYYSGNQDFSKMISVILSFVPGIYFIHSGFEFCNQNPVNTGLGFLEEEILVNPAESLALFSKSFMDFYDKFDLVKLIKAINQFKIENNIDLTFNKKYKINLLETEDKIVAFKLESNDNNLLIVANYSNLQIHFPVDNYDIRISTCENNSIDFEYLAVSPMSSVVLLKKK